MADTAQIIEHGKEVLIGNYARLPVVMVRSCLKIALDRNSALSG